MSGYITDLSKDLTCPICLEFFNHPIILPCSHVLCRSPCAENIFEVSSIRCPVCRDNCHMSGGISSLPRVITLESIIEKVMAEQSRAAANQTRINLSRAPDLTNHCKTSDSVMTDSTSDWCSCKCSPNKSPVTFDSNIDIPDSASMPAFLAPSRRMFSPSCSHGLLELLNSNLATSTEIKSITSSLPSAAMSILSENKAVEDLWFASTDQEVQSKLSPTRNSRHPFLSPNSPIESKQEGSTSVSHYVNTNQNTSHDQTGTYESQRNKLLQFSESTSSVKSHCDMQAPASCNFSETDLDSPKLASSHSLDSGRDNHCSTNVTFPGCSVDRGDHNQTTDLKRIIQEHLPRLSDIQCQLLSKIASNRKKSDEIQNHLEKRYSEVNTECDSLVSEIENKRIFFLESADQASKTAMLKVDAAVVVAEELLTSSQQLMCLSEHFLNDARDDVVVTAPILLNRLTDFLRKCELCFALCQPRVEYGTVDFRHERALLAGINFLTTPSKAIINVRRCTRNHNTVALVITPPPNRDVIDSYEISYCSDEQKRQDIEEKLCIQCSSTATSMSHSLTFVLIENLSSNTHYYFSACAVNPAGWSPKSDLVHCMTLSPNHCVVPVPVIINNLCHTSTSDVSICCPSPTTVTTHQGVSHFVLYRQMGSDYSWEGKELQTREEHRIKRLHPETDYQLVVLARNLRGECQLSEKICLKTKASCLTD